MPDSLWDEWRGQSKGNDGAISLDTNTPMYADLDICLKILHMRYPEYMASTSGWERYLYRLFLALDAAKTRYAQEQRHRLLEAEREAKRQVPSQHTPYRV